MNSFADHWWLWLVALVVLLAFIWLMRARRKPQASEADLRDRTRTETATQHLGAASSSGAVDLAPNAGSAAEAIIEEARTPAATSETEAALKRASDAAPPQPISPPPASTPATGQADNLQLLKGVGPKLAARLGELGVTRFDQIAGWTDKDIAEIDAHLGTFKGRAQRDNWVDQAGYLSRGDKAGFEAKYGALGAEMGRK